MTNGGNWRFLYLCWFKRTSQSSMQTSHRCLYTFQPEAYPCVYSVTLRVSNIDTRFAFVAWLITLRTSTLLKWQFWYRFSFISTAPFLLAKKIQIMFTAAHIYCKLIMVSWCGYRNVQYFMSFDFTCFGCYFYHQTQTSPDTKKCGLIETSIMRLMT